MSLWSDFQGNSHGRLIHKWKHYFPAYERHFAPFVGRSATIIEIGIGEGGSLQMWKRFFGPHAQIVGIDIAPRCKAFEDDQIAVRIGSQADPEFLESVIAEFGPPDVVIDDGSHVMAHVAASFDVLYKRLSKNGIYLVEDLHTAYHPEYGGALRGGDSFIESSKALIDELNADFTRGELPATDFTRNTHSICFYDSIVVFERGTYTQKFAPQIGKAASLAGDSYPPGMGHDDPTGVTQRLELATRREEVAQLRAELEREREGFGHALGSIAEAETERQRLNAEIQMSTEAARESRNLIALLRQRLDETSGAREATLTSLAELRADFEAALQQNATAEHRSARMQERLAATETLVQTIVGSTSWRTTKPLRFVARWLRSLATLVPQALGAARGRAAPPPQNHHRNGTIEAEAHYSAEPSQK